MTTGSLIIWCVWVLVAGWLLRCFVKYGPNGDRWGQDRQEK